MQLNMNFNDVNPLKERFTSAKFTYLMEFRLPSGNDKLSKVYDDLNSICEYAEKDDRIAALTLTDRIEGDNCPDPLDLAAKVSARSGKSPIIHLSGKGHTSESIKDRLAAFSSDGLSNILAVSGDYDEKCEDYTDSVDIILEASRMLSKTYAGAAVNPFKYTVNGSYGQYFKMVRKIRAGAEFIVSQTGWDMKKLQELLLFCRMREINVPLIARLSLISEEDGRSMTSLSIHKGVPISREFASQVQRELSSSSQFMTTQLRRLCLQIIGCQLMGYSGVQLCGLKSANEIKTVMDSVDKMLQEYRTFREWVDEWNQFHHGVSMVTHPYTFYMFKNLMKYQTSYDMDDGFKLSEAFFEDTTLSQKLKYKLASMFKLEERQGVTGKILRSMLAGTGEEPDYNLKSSQYISLMKCPKKLFHGPCGGTMNNGFCENGKEDCVHNLRISLAAYRNELDSLEEP